MKRALLCGFLLAVMAATGTVIYMDTETVTQTLSERLVLLEEELSGDAGITAAAKQKARAISDEWEDFCAGNIFLTNNECAFEISETLIGVIAADRPESAAEGCRKTRMLLDVYTRSRRLDVDNIF